MDRNTEEDESAFSSLLEQNGGVGNFRRQGSSLDGVCVACEEPLKLSEDEMLRHLAEKHPESLNRNVLTIHEERRKDDDHEEGEEGAEEEEEGETTVLIVGSSKEEQEKEEEEEGGEGQEQHRNEEEDDEGGESLSVYFKETTEKDILECRICSLSVHSADILKHIVENHQLHDEEQQDDDYIMQTQQHDDDTLFMDRKRSFPEEDSPPPSSQDERAKRVKFSPKSTKDTRSLTWQFFEKVKGGDTEEVRCHLCDKRYHTAGGSTTVMLRHLNKDHPEDLKELKEEMLSDDPLKKNLKRTSRSVVWTYFLKGDESNSVLCKLCGKNYSSTDSSTGIMLRHLRRAHVKEYREEIMRREAEEEVEDPSKPVVLPTKKPPRKSQNSRSSAWSYFTRIGQASVKCNICSKDYSNIGGSTSAMIRHLRKSHKDEFEDNIGSKGKLSNTQPSTSDRKNEECSNVVDENEVYTLVVKNGDEESGEGDKLGESIDMEKLGVSVRILLEGIAHEGAECNYSDVKIICQEGQVVRTHKLILASTSLFMYEALKTLPETEEEVIISAPDFCGDQLKDFLDKIYIGGDTLTEGMLDIVNHFQFKMDFIHYPNRKLFNEETVKVFGRPEDSGTNEETIVYQTKVVSESGLTPCLSTLETVLEEDEANEIDVKVEKIPENGEEDKIVFASPFPKRKSAIWKYFVQSVKSKDCSICTACNRIIGTKQHSTSSMIKHLKRHHQALFEKFCLENSKTIQLDPSKPGSSTDPQKAIQEKTCYICLKVFSTKNKMIIHHKAVHLKIKAYTCDICGKSYSRVDTLKDHVASTHSSECPSFLCKYCGKTFKRRATRFRHERFHRNDRRHQCSYCPKKFFTSQTLRNHERTHTGEKPYECNECNRRFTMQHQLTTHLRVHTGDKPYSCSYCSETFKHSSSKNKHICPNMPQEEAHSISAGMNKRKPLSSLLTPTLIEETTEVILPITATEMVNDGGEITTTYHTVVKESVLKDISQHIELSSAPQHSETDMN